MFWACFITSARTVAQVRFQSPHQHKFEMVGRLLIPSTPGCCTDGFGLPGPAGRGRCAAAAPPQGGAGPVSPKPGPAPCSVPKAAAVSPKPSPKTRTSPLQCPQSSCGSLLQHGAGTRPAWAVAAMEDRQPPDKLVLLW